MYVENLRDIKDALDISGNHMEEVHDTLVGRDTHPLWDDQIHDPFTYFLAAEATRITDQIHALHAHCHNYLISNEEFMPSYVLRGFVHKVVTSPGGLGDQAFHVALAGLQDHLGVTDGGRAAMFFSDFGDTWKDLKYKDRDEIMKNYIEMEKTR